jgi:hypothetical protein
MNMSTIDALGLSEDWEKAGVPPEQARRMAAALNQRFENRVASQVDLQLMETRLDAKIDRVEEKLRGEIHASARSLMMWFTGAMIAQGAAIVALLRLLDTAP